MKKRTYIITTREMLSVLLLLVLLSHQTVHAQWVKTPGPPGINVNVFFNADTLLFAGTSSKGVFKSADHGTTWAPANKGLTNASVFSFIKDQNFLYAGTDKGVFRSSNSGASWTAANNGIQTQFIASMIFGGKILYAGTVTGGIFRSPDQGVTWTDANGGALGSSHIYAMCFVKSQNKLIAEADNLLFFSTDTGHSWNSVQGSTDFFVINHFLQRGDSILASASNGVFQSFDGGTTWGSFLPVDTDNTTLVGFSSLGNKVYTGDKNGVFSTTNFGLTWKPVAATGLRSVSTFRTDNFFIRSGNNFLIGMDELGVMRSADTGHNWTQSIAGLPAASTIDNALLALHDTLLSGTHTDGIYSTANNGKTWIKTGTSNNEDTLSNAIVFALLSPAPNILLAGTGGNGLYRSVDNGRTWKHITDGLPFTKFGNNEIDKGLAKSGNHVLIATGNGIYFSTNNGKSWHASNLTGERISAAAIAANGSIAVAGVSEGVSPFQSGVYRSTNNGETWSLASGAVLDIVALASDGNKTFYAGTLTDNWRSSINGVAWQQIGSGIPAGNGGFAIKVIDSIHVFIGNSLGVFFSNNRGTNFTDVSTGLNPAPNNSVEGIEANSTFLFAGLFKNGVWKRPLSDFGILPALAEMNSTINLQKVPEADYKSSISIYPVPATDKVTISCKINKGGEVQVLITDPSGKAVKQWKETAATGVYTKTIQVSNLAPGLYLLKLTKDGEVLSGKIVVEK